LRTDADTVPREDWIDAASTFLGREPHKQLITGAVLPLQDAFYRPSDEVVLPVAYVGYRLGAAALQRSTWPLRVVRGANMAVRPEAYTAVGGFPNGTIAEQDEDIELTKRMHTAYGFDALANVENMVVRTSMRRIRTVGLHGLVAYYTYRSGRPDPSQRDRLSGGDIDIRNIPKKNRKLF
jgi:cellulose synthase/poly-beta-1,6-N-acetylglucosamine synthase-like glycosyltransferase